VTRPVVDETYEMFYRFMKNEFPKGLRNSMNLLYRAKRRPFLDIHLVKKKMERII